MPKKDRATEKLEEALSALERAMESASRIIGDAIQGLRGAVAQPRRPGRRRKTTQRRR